MYSPAWTLRHGHFLIMGGFHLVEPVEENSTSAEATTGTQQAASDIVNVHATSTPAVEGTNMDAEKGPAPGNKAGRVTILTLEMLRELVKHHEFRIQTTEKEITDRSKGDGLAKIILILQSSWFIFQCIARCAQGLGLTQLELTTVALASLNGITFILWWYKPLGVEAPVRVYMTRKLTDVERATEGVSDLFSVATPSLLTCDCSEVNPSGPGCLPTAKDSLGGMWLRFVRDLGRFYYSL